jgi:hypothetical protein
MKTWIAAALALATGASAHAAPLDHIAWRTPQGFEQAYREGVKYGFEHNSAFSSSRCDLEGCHIGMEYQVDGESYAFLTSLAPAKDKDRGNRICVERPDEHFTCANDHGRVWTMRKIDGDWKEVRRWQDSWPVEALPFTKLSNVGFAAPGLGVLAVCFVMAGCVLAWSKRHALKLMGKDFKAFMAQRDAHGMDEVEMASRGTPPIPTNRIMALIALTHPDKHNGSRLATETTQWLLSLRASRIA